MLRVKGQDGFCPLGPVLVDAAGRRPRRPVAADLRRRRARPGGAHGRPTWSSAPPTRSPTSSRLMTLEPGDVLLTGTPAHSRPVQPGQVVDVEIEGIGRLSNPVVELDRDLEPVGEQPRGDRRHAARRAGDARGRGRARGGRHARRAPRTPTAPGSLCGRRGRARGHPPAGRRPRRAARARLPRPRPRARRRRLPGAAARARAARHDRQGRRRRRSTGGRRGSPGPPADPAQPTLDHLLDR